MTKKAGLLKLDEGGDFKKNNLEEWKKNSSFWLEGKMRHIKDVKHKTLQQLMLLIKANTKNRVQLADVGCGEGWLYRAIREADLPVNYAGLDFNERFIKELKKQYREDATASFLQTDIEDEVPQQLIGKTDIVVNAFNFFELPNLEKAMSNTYKMLKRDGKLLIITIDPVMQVLAISKSYSDFFNNLTEYSKGKSHLAYRKKIVINDQKTGRAYYGILYSIADYIELAKKYKLQFLGYEEVINPDKPTPQIYQFLLFSKSK